MGASLLAVAKYIYYISKLVFTDCRLFRRVLAELLLFDPLKNKRCWNQG